MRHQQKKSISAKMRAIAIANIKSLLKQDKVAQAIDCAEIAGISPEDFGLIVKECNKLKL